MNTPKSNRGFHRLAAICGVIGPVVFFLIVIIAGALYSGYSHLSQVISELGAIDSPVQIWQTINFFLTGAALTLFVLSFHQRFEGSSKLTTGLLLYFTIFALIGSGIFPCAPGCATSETTSGMVHNLLGLTGFIAFTIAMFLIAGRMQEREAWSERTTYTRVTGFLSVAFFLSWAIGAAVLPNLEGLFQRLMILTFLQWFVVMGYYLLKQPVKEGVAM